MNILQRRGEGNSAQAAQQQRLMRQALEEDPSIFQYDEHYDDLKAQQTSLGVQKKEIDKKVITGVSMNLLFSCRW